MIQNYIDRINAHNWGDPKLKSALILAVYVNCGLVEFSRSLGSELPIDIENIINNLIAVDNKQHHKEL
jgi:hypothetical protein